jgi:hypothetical protein
VRAALAAVSGATLLVGGAPLVPGSHIGSAKLVRGAAPKADEKLFDFCNPIIEKAGVYRRSCRSPKVARLFIGYGAFEANKAALDADWKTTSWGAWLDGRRIALRRFGTSDRMLYAFPPAGGKDVTLREWRVMLLHAKGRHRLRYRFRGPLAGPAGGTVDATFTFTLT